MSEVLNLNTYFKKAAWIQRLVLSSENRLSQSHRQWHYNYITETVAQWNKIVNNIYTDFRKIYLVRSLASTVRAPLQFTQAPTVNFSICAS